MAESNQKPKKKGVSEQLAQHRSCQFRSEKPWLELQYHKDNETIKKPNELEKEMQSPPSDINYGDIDYDRVFDRIHGSMIGTALGDALGASVEFRPRAYMVENRVTTLQGGGTWGLEEGQFTDDTSMALCLANSLVVRGDYVPYDQLVRYKWWHKRGYMSSTGQCFDIGAATKTSLDEFERRQKKFAEKYKIPMDQIDYLSNSDLLNEFKVNCSEDHVAGNGALMRLAPVPLFFYRDPPVAVENSGLSGQITHGDKKARDACRYYGALIVAAVRGEPINDLFDEHFYENHEDWFGSEPLELEIMKIARGSYQKRGGYDEGIRGKGYIVSALEAALWAFWSNKDKPFEAGALDAVNLGDDTDTTAAIYGQLAGACYGYRKLPKKWKQKVYAKDFIECLSQWILYEGTKWFKNKSNTSPTHVQNDDEASEDDKVPPLPPKKNATTDLSPEEDQKNSSKQSLQGSNKESDLHTNDMKRTHTFDNNRPRRASIDIPGNTKNNTHRESRMHRTTSEEHLEKIFSNDTVYSEADVCCWIRELGTDYAAYAKVFKDKGVDGYWLLNHVNDTELQKYEITNEEHRQGILEGIEKLKQKPKLTKVPNQKPKK